MSSFRAAAIQMRSGIDPERNAADLATYIADAASRGAVYIQTPEMTGALQRDRKSLASVLKGESEDIIVRTASELAAKHGIHLHIGSTAIARDDGKIANRAFLFGPDGNVLTRYDKIHMFDVDLDNGESWRESAVYAPGGDTVVIDLPFARLGLAICYDVRFPQLFRAQALAGASVISAPAAFTRQTGEAHWHVLQRARAIENGAFMISAAQGGVHEDGRETYGHSMIVAPWGEILAEADHAEPGVIVAEVDPALSAAARAKVPNLKNARPFGVVVENEGQATRFNAAS
ncbi:carbon-nitrogen hydrolase family protein [Phyllobacterium endophyticum]|uniref:carbon-nitrogen hydrolase family protein n=1 Tax=Phyllobacterium endophyticum TaxID=1149773 RepID=UPI0011C71E0B|nr:carbon-nitrogen hydrolase family protein [Phyllobacterium endophyticum]TXR46635.1 carbon-nitrogen hydrolase family protein [Phyllobacterium endophyticum]